MPFKDNLPKSRLNLRYRTEINGEPEDIVLPLRLLIAGDFSGKKTTKKPFDERKIISFDRKNRNIKEVMQEMNIKLQVKDSAENPHTIPIQNVESFLPGNIIESIDSMNEMAKAQKKLSSLLSSINNSNKFRTALTTLLGDKESLESLKQLIAPSYKTGATLPDSVTAEKNS